MYTTENSGGQGLSRQALADPNRSTNVHGTKTAWGDTAPPSAAYPSEAFSDGVHSTDGGLSGAVQDMLTSFASPTWKPHGYQERGIDWLTQRISAALFLAPGLGKTSITLAAIQKLRKDEVIKRVLILAPLKVAVTTWDTEPKKWAQFASLKIGLAHGPNRVQVLQDPSYDIVVMNYDGLPWAAGLLAKGHKFDVLVCDELTRLKHASSKRFKLIKPLLPTFTFKWGLTASPAANGLIDLFGQVYALDLGHRLGRYITHFRAKYFHQEPWDQYRWYISPEKSLELTAKLEDLAMSINAKEYLTLPDLIDVVRPVKLASMQEYKFLRDEYILKMRDTVVTAANAGVLTSKLRQFTGGAIYLEDHTYQEVGREKLDELVELVEELNGEPLIVVYQYTHEAERILKIFPTARAIRGGMSTKETQEVVALWNSSEVPVLLVQPQAASFGLNLQAGGAAMCWFSLDYNLELYEQMVARIYRQGQAKAVRNYILSCEGTIDEVLAKVLSAKDKTQAAVLRALEGYGKDV